MDALFKTIDLLTFIVKQHQTEGSIRRIIDLWR